MASQMPLPANTASPGNKLTLPDQKTAPVSKASPIQQMTRNQKKKKARRQRSMNGLKTKSPIATTAVTKILACGSEAEEAAAGQEMMVDKDYDEELSDKIKLDSLAKKTEELQGYVNQLQDAVTIGMFQLRDLKKLIATTAASLATADE